MNEVARGVLAAAREGQPLSDRQIHAALVSNGLAARIDTALALAVECLRLRQLEQALALLELAWRLGARHEGVLDVLVALLRGKGRARDAFDRVREGALACSERRDFEGVLRCLSLSHELSSEDKESRRQPQDFCITQAVRHAFESFTLPQRSLPAQAPLRIGYVFWGDTAPGCRLPYLFVRIAEHHDRARYSPAFFSECGEHAFTDPATARLRGDCAALGIPFHLNPRDATPDTTPFARARGLCEAIAREEIDILVFQGQTPVFFATALMRPAPIVVGFDHGSPAMYSSVALDACIASVDRFVIEHLCDAMAIEQRENCFLPAIEPVKAPLQRGALELPADAVVVMTVGMPSKFAPAVRGIEDYFAMVVELLQEDPRVHWVVVGVTMEELSHVRQLLEPVRRQVRLLGRTDGIEHLLPLADVYLDTFPISGGLSVFQAMRQGLACVTYRFYWNQLFDPEREYSMVGDYLDGSEVVVPEPTLAAVKQRLVRLVLEPSYRAVIGELGAKQIEAQADVPRFVRACEARYLQLAQARGFGAVEATTPAV